ncbi:MAG: gliding motility-associated C-terminal domain-containing protein [Cytophagales bacterium]|nr:MAG: gliding motility-associated C-terminal domain-containing protein [Cytophagales bacterium]
MNSKIYSPHTQKITYLLFYTLLLGLFSLLGLSKVQAQCSKTTEGTEFWLGFADARDGTDEELSITVTSRVGATVSVFGGASSTLLATFIVPAGGSVKTVVPELWENETSEIIEDKGIRVECTAACNVYALSYQRNSADATLIYPTTTLGDKYYIMSYAQATNLTNTQVRNSEFVIVATQDATSITIIPNKITTALKPANVPFSITLNKGQSYQVKSGEFSGAGTALPAGQGDLTGSKVTSSKPIAVFGANIATVVPNINTCCWDHLYEQMPPTAVWGKEYITVPYKTRLWDVFRVLARIDGTVVSIDGAPVATLNEGQFYEFNTTGSNFPKVITGTNPIMVMHFSTSTNADAVSEADPFMINLSPTEQSVEDITFVAFTSTVITAYYLNILTETSNVPNMRLDGVLIAPTSFTAVPGTVFSRAQLNLTPGTHRLTNSGSGRGFTANIYGYGPFESYGYAAGVNLTPQLNFLFGSSSVDNDAEDFCDSEGAQTFVAEYSVPGATLEYKWKNLTTGAIVSTTDAMTANVFSSTTDYELTIDDIGGSCSIKDTLRVIFYKVPTAEVKHADSTRNTYNFCLADGEQSFSGTHPDNAGLDIDYFWISMDSGDTLGTASSQTLPVQLGSFQYMLHTYNSSDTSKVCFDADTITLVYNTGLPVDIKHLGIVKDTVVFCDDDGAQTLDASHPSHTSVSYQWRDLTRDNDLGTASTQTANIFGQNTLYEVEVTNLLTGCTSKDSILVVFFAANVRSGGTVVSDTFRFCDDDGPRVLDAFDPLNGPTVEYQWKDLGTGTVVSSTSVLNAANFSDTTVYEIFLRDVVSTCEARDTIMVIFRPTPTAIVKLNGVSMSSYILCNGSGSVRLNGFAATNQHVRYQWRRNGTLISTDTAITVTDVSFGTFTYLLTTTDTVSNCVATDEIVITVYPRLSGRTTGSANICAGKTTTVTFTLAGSFPMNMTYSVKDITTGAVISTTTISGITASPVTLTVGSAGIYQISALSSVVGCTASASALTDSARIQVIPVPNVVLTSNDFDNKICRDQGIKFTATGAAFYRFFINGVLMQEGTSANYTPPVGILNTGDLVWATGVNPPTDCGDTSNVITMTVNRIPVTSIGVSPRELCPGGDSLKLTSTLVGATGAFTYDWRKIVGSTAVPVGTGKATLSVIDTGRYFLIITENLITGCQYRTDTIKVNFKAPPVLNVRDTVVCMDNRPAILVAQDLTHGSAITYQWFNTANPTAVIGTAGTLAVNSAGLYRVIIRDTLTGCTRTDLARVDFNPNPDFEIKGHDKPLCEGRDTLTLDASNLDSMQIVWVGDGLIQLGTDQRSRIVTKSGVVTVIVTDTSKSTLCRTIKSIDVIINDKPIINPKLKDYVVCEDTTLRIEALHPTHASNATYQWRNLTKGTVAGTESALVLSFEEDYSENIYEILVTHPNSGCTSRDTTSIRFQKKSNAEISIERGQLKLCVGESVVLRASGGTGYLWNTGETTELISFKAIQKGFFPIVLTGDFNTTCGQSKDTVEIEVRDQPLAAIPDTLITVCQTTPLVIDAALPEHDFYTLYTWTNLSNGETLSNQSKLVLTFDSLTSPTFDPFQVVLRVQDSLTNCFSQDTVVVNFERGSKVQIDSNAVQEVCLGDSITLSASGAARYVWNTGDTTATIKVKAEVAGFMTFIVKADAANLCASTSDTLFVRVRPLPRIQAHTQDTVKICADDSLTLYPSGGLSYEWLNDPLLRDTITVSPQKPTMYYTLGTDAFGCKNLDSVFVDVSPTIDLGPDLIACLGDTLIIGQVSSDSTATYSWSPSGQQTPIIQVWKSGTYTVKVQTAECSYKRSVKVNFKEEPKILLVQDTVFCFDPWPNRGVVEKELGSALLNPDTSARYVYVWTDSTGEIVGTEPVLKVKQGGKYYLKVAALYSVTCETNRDVQIDDACPSRIFVPNAFTPNNDGLNDYFQVFGGNIKFFEMMIFNRWGEVVYLKSTQDFGSIRGDDFWNGQYKGKDVMEGNYVYVIKYNSEDDLSKIEKVQGSFTLLR